METNIVNNLPPHGDEVEEILGVPPSWLVRWGITVFAVIVLGLVALGWLVRYPDLLPARIAVTTPYPPAPVVTRSAGKISAVLVAEGDSVSAGQLLAVMENPAQTADVAAVDALLRAADSLPAARLVALTPRKDLQLGDLQGTYADFIQKFEHYLLTSYSAFDLQSIRQLEQQIAQTHALNDALARQQNELEAELALLQRNLARQQQLLAQGAVAAERVEEMEVLLIRRRREREDLAANILNNRIRISQLDRQITDLQKNIHQTHQAGYVALRESGKVVQSQLQAWRQTFLLTAPASGRVSLHPRTQVGQYAEAQTEIMTVLPAVARVIGRVMLPVAGSGKVKVGQRVNVKLDGYPFREYGMLHGKVAAVAPLPRDEAYLVEIAFPQGLTTTHGTALVFQQEMLGVAEIVTDNRRLLARLTEQLRYALARDYPVLTKKVEEEE